MIGYNTVGATALSILYLGGLMVKGALVAFGITVAQTVTQVLALIRPKWGILG